MSSFNAAEYWEGRLRGRELPQVALAIVNFNGWEDTVQCLESVRELNYPNYLCVLVDNNSSDDSVERIRAWAEGKKNEGFVMAEYQSGTSAKGGTKAQEKILEATALRDRMVLIRSRENLGPTGGANIAIDYALHRKPQADYVFLLDNDALIDPQCLNVLVDLEQREKPGIVGGVTLDMETGNFQFAERTTPLRFFFSPPVHANLPLPDDPNSPWETANANGPAMLIRRDVLEAVYAVRGYYLNELHYRMGWEFEFCHFSSRLGYKTLATRKAFVRHKGELGYRQTFNPGRYYYMTRNSILMARAFLPIQWRLLYYVYYPALTAARIARVLQCHRPDVASAVLQGLFDGYRGVTGRWKNQPA